MEILPISGIAPSSGGALQNAGLPEATNTNFADVLKNVVNGANQDLQSADQTLADFANGKTDDIDAVVMSTVKADLSFRFLLEMRNKLTESYQELSRMQF